MIPSLSQTDSMASCDPTGNRGLSNLSRLECNKYFDYLGLADKLRMVIFRCAAPLNLTQLGFPIKIITTLWLNFQVQRTANI
jgi:hypothetical protein